MTNWLNQTGALRRKRLRRLLGCLGIGLACTGLVWMLHSSPTVAQSSDSVEEQEDAVIQQYALPRSAPPAPVVRPQPQPRRAPAPARNQSTPAPRNTAPAPQAAPAPSPAPAPSAPAAAASSSSEEPAPAEEAKAPALNQYAIQFNRAPVVGNALQMEGILSQARLGFTRPRHWQVESAKVLVRFRHSPALYSDRSNLTVRLNNYHLGSVPLNREADEIGNVLFDVPSNLLQDFNTVIIQAQQHTSQDCTDPTDPTLWTEILPDSQVVLSYRPQPISLDFANYPYPFFDPLGLEADRVTYLKPQTVGDLWLTASGRFQAAASRLSNARPMQTRLVETLDQAKVGERLVVIGTPAEQPALADLSLPFDIKDKQVLDGNGNPLPDGVGVLMLTTTADQSIPILVATGNAPTGVLKAVQALVQPGDRELLTGQVALVNEVAAVPSPEPRDWPGYLPASRRRLLLSDLETSNQQPFQDVTVNGLPVPPPVQIPLRALPDQKFLRGSKFTLHYSYGPNIDPKRSSVSILLNDQGIGGERLTSVNGGTDSITVDIPPELVTPTSTLAVQFYTYPRMAISCGEIPDQPMWGTVHGDSSFRLNQGQVMKFPDLKLLQTGFPLTAPQDLSEMSFVLNSQPANDDILTLLQVSDRLGRLSRSQSVKLSAYQPDSLPESAREQHLVAIGLRDEFPLPEVFQTSQGFSLGGQFLRQQNQTQLQTLPDQAGVIRATPSPWHQERLLLGLTGQTPAGLTEIRQVFQQDALFSRLAGDTVLVERTTPEPSVYNLTDYRVTTLNQQSPRTVNRSGLMNRTMAFLQTNWFLIPGGIMVLALLLYGVSQLYLNRISRSEGV